MDKTLRKIKKRHTQEELDAYFAYYPTSGTLTWKTSTGPNCKVGSEAGWKDKSYRRVQLDGTTYMVHRIIWCLVYGFWPTYFVDHKNTDTFDNSLDNLRMASRSENNYNTCKLKNNTSGVKGISWHKRHHKWYARVAYEGSTYFVGLFTDLNEAAKALELKRQDLHKEFTHHG